MMYFTSSQKALTKTIDR